VGVTADAEVRLGMRRVMQNVPHIGRKLRRMGVAVCHTGLDASDAVGWKRWPSGQRPRAVCAMGF